MEKTSSNRLFSLDAFRGITIILMLLVNNMVLDVYTPYQLTHAPWGAGLNLADLVFPWFLFCVGVAIPFSSSSFRSKVPQIWKYELKIVLRTIGIFILGLIVDSSIMGHPYFGLGVLQIIALSYFIGVFLSELPLYRRFFVAVLLLAGYWAILKYIPVPGVAAGVLGEKSNIIRHLNITYLSHIHLSGLLSLIPVSALVLIGTIVGEILDYGNQKLINLAFLIGLGSCLVSLGYYLSSYMIISKAIWTPPYIIITAGLGCLVLSVFYLVLDISRLTFFGFPFAVFGSSAIFAYVAPVLTKTLILQKWTVVMADGSAVTVQNWMLNYLYSTFGRVGGGWTYVVGYLFVWWFIMMVLYVKGIKIKI